MSKGNIIQGQASGKLGDTVLMVRNGQQLARVYTKAGARSGSDASESARIQRVKFGSASNQWSLYRYVCTRMYRKGRKSTQSDYNYFVKRNSHLFPYLSKSENADGVHCLMPGQFSEGNLGRIELIHHVVRGTGDTPSQVNVYDANAGTVPSRTWTAKLSLVKGALAARYANARKITFLFSIPQEVELSEGSETFVSQFVSHFPVTLDLYNEITPGENEMATNAYFASKVGNPQLAALFTSYTDTDAFGSTSVIIVKSTSDENRPLVESLGILVFATDDIASDCYTTMLQDTSIPTTYGAYAVWGGYRTQNSLRVSADSYGYQSGVLRDEIASLGDDLSEQVSAYTARLRSIDSAAADAVLAEIKSSGISAKAVRKVSTPSESKE